MKENFVSLNAEMFNFEKWVTITNPKSLKLSVEELLKKSNFNIIHFTEHYFPIEGYTCVWILAESHLAIHTFPKDSKSYIQISSCNKNKLDIFQDKIELHFST